MGKRSARHLEAATNQVAHRLLKIGVEVDSRVALMLGNRPLYLEAYLAIQKLGAITVRVNTDLRDAGLYRLLHLARVTQLVMELRYASQVQTLLPSLPGLRRILVVDDGFEGTLRDERALTLAPGELAASPECPPASPPTRQRDDLVEIKYSSGTTGPAKALHVYRDAPALRGLPLYSRILYRRDDVIWSCLPLHHDVALWMAFGAALWCGAQFALAPRFSARRFWTELRESGATHLHATGAMIAILLRQPRQPRERDHSVRSVLASGCPPQLWHAFERRFGLQLWEGYGASDGDAFGCLNLGHSPPGSIGRPFQRYAVVDPADRPVAAGEAGELIFYLGRRSAFGRSLEQPEAAMASRAKQRDGWLRTGDRVRADSRGHLFFEGRLDDRIRCGGENVSPHDVEAAARSHPGIHDCAAYPVPSPLAGDDVMLAVLPVAGARLHAPAIASFLAARLPRCARPRHLRFVDALPRTSTQRLDRKALVGAGITTDSIQISRLDAIACDSSKDLT